MSLHLTSCVRLPHSEAADRARSAAAAISAVKWPDESWREDYNALLAIADEADRVAAILSPRNV